MKGKIKKVVSENYRIITVISIISFFVILSGTIFVLNYLNTNPENSNNHNPTSDSDVFDGYNLFVLERKQRDNNLRSLELLITDMDGEVIVSKPYTEEPHGLDVYPVELFNTTTVLLGAEDGAVLWNFVTNVTLDLNFKGHHDLEYNVNNDTFFTMSWYSTVMPDGHKYGFDRIHEYDWQGNEKWSLNTRDFVNTSWWCPYQDLYTGERRDLTHGNTVFYNSEEDVIYYLSRNCNTFFKIDHKTKEILWALGEYGDFSLFDQYGNKRDHLFFHAHSVEKIDNDTFILFDNDMHNQTKRDNHRSRILELVVDETSMTARESWIWAAPEEYYSDIWGDADRLPNGNRLGTFGTHTHPDTNIGPRLVEVNASGDIVWELNFPTSEEFEYGIYRMERFRFTPTINFTDWTMMMNNVTVNWQTWYNFRTKHPVQGSYKIYLDDLLVKNESHMFEKWWLPSSLTVNLGQLTPGVHNVTAIITDTGGNSAINTVIIHIPSAFDSLRDEPMVFGLTESRKRFPRMLIILSASFQTFVLFVYV
ncbi:MAG: aryl-sulfate sulfotransferase [Promethearchaeota archaeon]